MNPSDYSKEQVKDISERVDKARKMLAELQLNPSATVAVEALGNDVFATKVIPYLADMKYSATLSPIQP